MQVAAGAVFRDLGMELVAEGEPPAVDDLEAAARRGDLLVAEVDGEVVGFVRLRPLDGGLQVVLPPDVTITRTRRIAG